MPDEEVNSIGRRTDGRFAAGNKGGPGNPHAAQTAALRSALLDAMTPEKMKAIAERLITRAIAGDVASAKLVLDRTLGRVELPVRLERGENGDDERLMWMAHMYGIRLDPSVPAGDR